MSNVCSFIFWDPFNNCSFLSGTQDQTMNGEFWIQLLILLGHESYFHHFFFFMVTSRINETSKWWFKQWFVYRGTKKRCVCVCVCFEVKFSLSSCWCAWDWSPWMVLLTVKYLDDLLTSSSPSWSFHGMLLLSRIWLLSIPNRECRRAKKWQGECMICFVALVRGRMRLTLRTSGQEVYWGRRMIGWGNDAVCLDGGLWAWGWI